MARVAPAGAVAAVAALPGRGADLTGVVPRLAFHYDPAAAAWRLVYLLENVSVGPDPGRRGPPLPGGKPSSSTPTPARS